jgi:ankyrin repeat protein
MRCFALLSDSAAAGLHTCSILAQPRLRNAHILILATAITHKLAAFWRVRRDLTPPHRRLFAPPPQSDTTVLQLATYYGQVRFMDKLLAKGADIDAKDKQVLIPIRSISDDLPSLRVLMQLPTAAP